MKRRSRSHPAAWHQATNRPQRAAPNSERASRLSLLTINVSLAVACLAKPGLDDLDRLAAADEQRGVVVPRLVKHRPVMPACFTDARQTTEKAVYGGSDGPPARNAALGAPWP